MELPKNLNTKGSRFNKKNLIIVGVLTVVLVVSISVIVFVGGEKPEQNQEVSQQESIIQKKIQEKTKELTKENQVMKKWLSATDLTEFENQRNKLYQENKELVEDMVILKNKKQEFESKYYGNSFRLVDIVQDGSINDPRFSNFQVYDYENTRLLKQTRNESYINFKNIDFSHLSLKTHIRNGGYTIIQFDKNVLTITIKNNVVSVMFNNEQIERYNTLEEHTPVGISIANKKIFINNKELDTFKETLFSKIYIKVKRNTVEDLILN